MSYKFLGGELWSLADDVVTFYGANWGITPARIRREEPLLSGLGFVPTLHALSRDQHWICVEVATTPYTPSLDRFVLECRNRGLPVRLYVAVPETSTSSEFQSELRRARSNGVGVLEATATGIQIVSDALSLSLTDVRIPDPKRFAASLRATVVAAHQTFRGGDPAKGCLRIYEELEDLTRKLAAKAKVAKAWRGLPKGQLEPNLGNTDKAAWASIAKILVNHLDGRKLGRPALTEALLARVMGITSHRNESGHKPKTRAALQRRDTQLRTRFENAVDLLEEFARACSTRK